MLKQFTIAVATAAAVVFGAAGTPVSAQPAAEFYKGRTVTIIYGYGPGGSYGQYTQLVAQYLEPHIGAKIITQSMPGAGGLKSSNYVYNVSPKDGSVLFMPSDTVVISQLLESSAAKYNAKDFRWLGVVSQSNAVLVLRKDAGVKTYADLKTKQVAIASTGRGSQTELVPRLINGILDTKMKIVSGYEGSAKGILAMEQGEVQGLSLNWDSWVSQRGEWIKSGFAVPVLQLGLSPEKELPEVPMLTNLVSGPNLKLAQLVATLSAVGRSIATPPGVPEDRLAHLRKGFGAMLSDPAFLADAEKRNLRIQPSPAEAVEGAVRTALDIDDEMMARARKVIGDK